MSEDPRQFGIGTRDVLKLSLLQLFVTFSVVCGTEQSQASEGGAYPTRPVRLIVPWPAGGGADTVGRILAQQLTNSLGAQVIVDNRAGAAGIIGTEIAARAQPDGYTLLLPTVTTGINPHLHRKLSYDAITDFEPIVLIASAPYVLAIHPSLPVRTVRELVALAKSKPKQLNYASTGNGSAPHLTAAWFATATGCSIVHVPYKGGPIALNDLIAGHVQMAFGNVVNYLPQVRAGKLRALAVTSAKRTPQAPDLPTMIESGVSRFATGTWFGLQAPARTAQPVVERLNREVNGFLKSADVRARLASEGADPIGGTPQEFAAYIKQELARWAEVIQAADLKPE